MDAEATAATWIDDVIRGVTRPWATSARPALLCREPEGGWARSDNMTRPSGTRPHRLVAKDTTLSRWRHGFESRWGCHVFDLVAASTGSLGLPSRLAVSVLRPSERDDVGGLSNLAKCLSQALVTVRDRVLVPKGRRR